MSALSDLVAESLQSETGEFAVPQIMGQVISDVLAERDAVAYRLTTRSPIYLAESRMLCKLVPPVC